MRGVVSVVAYVIGLSFVAAAPTLCNDSLNQCINQSINACWEIMSWELCCSAAVWPYGLHHCRQGHGTAAQTVMAASAIDQVSDASQWLSLTLLWCVTQELEEQLAKLLRDEEELSKEIQAEEQARQTAGGLPKAHDEL